MIQISLPGERTRWRFEEAALAGNNGYALQLMHLVHLSLRNLEWSVRKVDENVVQQRRKNSTDNKSHSASSASTFRCFSFDRSFTSVFLSPHIFPPHGCWGQPSTWCACLESLTCNHNSEQKAEFLCRKKTLSEILLSLWHVAIVLIILCILTDRAKIIKMSIHWLF